jgi:hypothetical protein
MPTRRNSSGFFKGNSITYKHRGNVKRNHKLLQRVATHLTELTQLLAKATNGGVGHRTRVLMRHGVDHGVYLSGKYSGGGVGGLGTNDR